MYTKKTIERFLKEYKLEGIRMVRGKVLKEDAENVEEQYEPSDKVKVELIFNLKEDAGR